MKVKNLHLQLHALYTLFFAIAKSISIQEYVAKSSLHLVTLLVLHNCFYISCLVLLIFLALHSIVLKCAFLVGKRFQDIHEPFLIEVKHLGPHRHTNKQSPTDIKIFLYSWALSLQLCNLITGHQDLLHSQ